MKHTKLFFLVLLLSTLSFANLESRRLPFTQSTQSLEKSLRNVEYIFCFDFGGLKTTLHILDEAGQLISLKKKNGELCTSFSLSGANINYVGMKGFKKVLNELIVNLTIASSNTPLNEILPKSAAIASIAGLTRDREKKAISQIMADFGFPPDHVYSSNDAELAHELIEETGLILISSGTGSICFGKSNHSIICVGGLGPLVGGEGSGYHIGIEAIKAAIADELGWGKQTSLTETLRKHYKIEELHDLVSSINSRELAPYSIASTAPLVFQEASKGDDISQMIIDLAAREIGKLLALGLQRIDKKNPLVYCLGGLFRNSEASSFLDKIVNSEEIQTLKPKAIPLIVNIANESPVLLTVQETLKKKNLPGYRNLVSLPIVPEASYENLKQKCSLRTATTELDRPDTRNLSALFQESIPDALKQLMYVDREVTLGFAHFCENHLNQLHHLFSETLSNQGRIFLVGAGSSGRIAKDLAARWSKFWKDNVACETSTFANSIIGIMSGGPKAVLSTTDNDEDDEETGREVIEQYAPKAKDLVILISSSGSTQFNIGVGKAAKEHDAQICYILNTTQIPTITQTFLESYNILPLVIDIGPPAIPGCTRLQGSSLIMLCLGATMNITAKSLTQVSPVFIENLAQNYLQDFRQALGEVESKVNTITDLTKLQIELFSHPNANFFNLTDTSNQGYVTFLGDSHSTREILLDVAEIPPSFSTNFPKTIKDKEMKKAEFRAYMLTQDDNIRAWETLLQQPLSPEQADSVNNFILSSQTEGTGSLLERPLQEGNLLIAVLYDTLSAQVHEMIQTTLNKVKASGGKTALIITHSTNESKEKEIASLASQFDYHIPLHLNVTEDPLGIIQGLTIKQVLNLLSNGSMLGMHKVYGNRIIDLIPSSDKVVDQCIRTLQAILKREFQEIDIPPEELLFHYITRAYKYKTLVESQQHHYSPSPIRLSLAMIKNQLPLEKAIETLKDKKGNLHLTLF